MPRSRPSRRARGDPVVREVLVGHRPVLVPDQAIGGDAGPVEGDLRLGVEGDGVKGAGQVGVENSARASSVVLT